MKWSCPFCGTIDLSSWSRQFLSQPLQTRYSLLAIEIFQCLPALKTSVTCWRSTNIWGKINWTLSLQCPSWEQPTTLKEPNYVVEEVEPGKQRLFQVDQFSWSERTLFNIFKNFRYRSQERRLTDGMVYPSSNSIVPPLPSADSYPRKDLLPQLRVPPDRLFVCYRVYDFRQKRVLKNPSWVESDEMTSQTLLFISVFLSRERERGSKPGNGCGVWSGRVDGMNEKSLLSVGGRGSHTALLVPVIKSCPMYEQGGELLFSKSLPFFCADNLPKDLRDSRSFRGFINIVFIAAAVSLKKRKNSKWRWVRQPAQSQTSGNRKGCHSVKTRSLACFFCACVVGIYIRFDPVNRVFYFLEMLFSMMMKL